MMCLRPLHSLPLLLLAASSFAPAATLRVPASFATVGRAIAAAAPGDTVAVAAGTYREALQVAKPLVLLGGWDAGFRERDPVARASVLDGAGAGRSVLTITGERGEKVVVGGFTIRNGWTAEGNGGGVVVLGDVHAVIQGCVIRDNYARYYGGGVCFLMGATGRLERNRILNNSVVFHGGGLCLMGRARVEALGNVFAGNRVVTDSGGAIAALEECVLTAIGNRFEKNAAGKRGGAVSLIEECDGTLARNLLVGNACGAAGGAVYASRSALRMDENTLVRNFGPGSAGILLAGTGSATIRRNLVARCGGPWIRHEGSAALTIEGNVLYASGPAEDPAGAPAIRGARVADPLFCDEAEDQRLRPGSPCRGAHRVGCYAATCGEEPGPGDPPLPWEAP